jgi:hypothetical protein
MTEWYLKKKKTKKKYKAPIDFTFKEIGFESSLSDKSIEK